MINVKINEKRRNFMKNKLTRILALSLVLVMSLAVLTACPPAEVKLSTDPYEGDVIYVGNTAGTTGAAAVVGIPFNFGINAALAIYNANGGFNGRTVELKTYDDASTPATSVTLMDQLIHEDNVFAIVGNVYAPCVEANLQSLKENAVPMVYAAAGNNILFNENATSDADRAIFPVQPLNYTEGRSLIVRAFAPALDAAGNLTGGLGAAKVGVISNSVETSKAMLDGIKTEAAASLTEEQRANIIYQEVASDDYSAAINALKNAGCDLVIVTVTGDAWTTVLAKMVDAGCTWSILTSYNNSSAALLNDTEIEIAGQKYKVMSATNAAALTNMKVYSQGWVNIVDVSQSYKYDGATLLPFYAALGQVKDGGVYGFTEEYWRVAEALYNYGIASGLDPATAFARSYDAYALAGYIAGDLFCQGLAKLQESGKELTRANYVEIMENNDFKVCMGDTISYRDGKRVGVEAFSLTYLFGYNGMATSTSITSGVSTLEDLKGLLK